MKIVVPMAGSGARFVAEGYAPPKPLIRLHSDGRTIIEHVLDMFREPNDEFVFICSAEHLAETEMAGFSLRARSGAFPGLGKRKAEIVAIPAHKKGPVWTCTAAWPHIRDDEPVIVSYCDGTMPIDRAALRKTIDEHDLDGCLITHTGFHPHVLSLTTKMAFVKPRLGVAPLIDEVKEKASYTDDPLSEHASSGVYYFRTGDLLKKYFRRYLNSAEGTYNGEHYVTLVYNLMIRDGFNVGYHDAPQVAILGTPDEVRNFEAWATILKGAQVRNEEDLLRCYRYWKEYRR